MPLLTIAIPTFNRRRVLELQLNELLKLNSEDVEILVSDNNSDDGTREFLESLDSQLPRLRKIRNESNLGFDGNLKSLYQAAHGDFVWFLSDDDLANHTEIKVIMDALINNPEIGLLGLIFNRSNSLTLKTRMVSYTNSGKWISLPVGTSFSSKGSGVVRTAIGTLVSQVSSCIVAKVDDLNLNFNGGGIAHSLISHLVLERKEMALFIDSNVVTLGVKEDISNWFMESCLNGVRVAYDSLTGILGEENCNLVADSTQVLGLKIAFWSFGNGSDKFNVEILRQFNLPRKKQFLYSYIFWYTLANLASQLKILPYLLWKLRLIYLKLKFKLKV
jgi:glycosyltransferase involved in cell wall biosynthesis